MGGINTDSIKNILETEGYTGVEYKDLFHRLVIFISVIISSQNKY